MDKKNRRFIFLGICFLVAFVIWTFLVRFVDVDAIGPKESNVGFATLNGYVHNRIGVNMALYTFTDWLGIIPICVAFCFAVLGLLQMISRKSFFKLDKSLLLLGAFYLVVIFVYVVFEIAIINYRPVLINGYLEASYPSSTTLLVSCVMPTAIIQLRARIKNNICKRSLVIMIVAFIAFMVVGRLVSGVHWITDIIGGALLSTGLVLIYYSISNSAAIK